MSNISFGTWLKGRRKALPLTQDELGARIGYSGRTIEKIESGVRRPSKAMALVLAETFRVPAAEHDAFVEFARSAQTQDQPFLLDRDRDTPWKPPPRTPNNLPTPLTGFIGREELIASALAMLARPDVRLLTLHGPPGVGKTRLSLQLAARVLASFHDGVFFVPLGSTHDPELVVPLIARALGLREAVGRPLPKQVGEYVRDKSMLLVLDNFEQVVQAGPTIASLLEASPGLKALVTSRSTLHLYGEYALPLPPLAVPDRSGRLTVEQAMGYDSIRLFAERAFAADPGFVLTESNVGDIAYICGSVDGLPLAIELAAARVGTLFPGEIVAKQDTRLELLAGGPINLPDRQRTLRAAIDWSYDLLSPEEQSMFRLMSVFVGGTTTDAISAVAPHLTEQTLAALTNKSLLVQEGQGAEARTGMLETLREYAWECLVAKGEVEAAKERHANYYLELAEAASQKISGPEQAAWLARMEQEHGNLRAALATLIERGCRTEALRLASSLWIFWHLRGYPSEGLRWLQDALAMESRQQVPMEVLGNAFNAAGNLAWTGSNYELAREMHERALEVRRKIGDQLKVGDSLNNLGIIAQMQRDYDRARVLFEQCLAIYRDVGDKGGAASALNNLGQIYLAGSDFAMTLAAQREAQRLWREVGSDFGIGVSLNLMGEAERFQGNDQRAYTLYKKVLKTYRTLSYKRGLAYTLHNMGHAAVGLGDTNKAVACLCESLMLCKELDHTEGIVMCMAGLGRVLLLRGRVEEATRVLGAVDKALEAHQVHLHPLEISNYRESVKEVRHTLGDEHAETLLQEGRGWSLEEATARARCLCS
ncbi:MAG TPA: tetratricopeptide repeat protein [Chloroflexia bacterium]|nr:tetratricopeptide repeat protein [Chloroflexia bacterium]